MQASVESFRESLENGYIKHPEQKLYRIQEIADSAELLRQNLPDFCGIFHNLLFDVGTVAQQLLDLKEKAFQECAKRYPEFQDTPESSVADAKNKCIGIQSSLSPFLPIKEGRYVMDETIRRDTAIFPYKRDQCLNMISKFPDLLGIWLPEEKEDALKGYTIFALCAMCKTLGIQNGARVLNTFYCLVLRAKYEPLVTLYFSRELERHGSSSPVTFKPASSLSMKTDFGMLVDYLQHCQKPFCKRKVLYEIKKPPALWWPEYCFIEQHSSPAPKRQKKANEQEALAKEKEEEKKEEKNPEDDEPLVSVEYYKTLLQEKAFDIIRALEEEGVRMPLLP